MPQSARTIVGVLLVSVLYFHSCCAGPRRGDGGTRLRLLRVKPVPLKMGGVAGAPEMWKVVGWGSMGT